MNFITQRAYERRTASSALIVVLFAVALATIILVAIMTTATLERQTAFYYKERSRADTFAQAGLFQAVGLLRTSIGASNAWWICSPGYMVTMTPNSSGGVTYSSSALYSGTNNTASAIDFNAQKFDGTYPLAAPQMLPSHTAQPVSMPIQWVYVYNDGSFSLAGSVAGKSAVGRYAFWVDSNSSRINLNTAWSRGATNAAFPGS